jgi:antirestriction protein ArdC
LFNPPQGFVQPCGISIVLSMKNTVYEIITDRILNLLKAGTVPWHKPWVSGPQLLPRNLSSGKQYKGLNIFLLYAMPYTSP